MFKNFRDKIALSGITVLMIGIALLVFTFISAYGFLTQAFEIIASGDLIKTFGEALAPLIATCIRIMYLGVMGWVGSLMTIRGVTIIANVPKPETATAIPQKPIAIPQKALPEKAKAKKPEKEAKPEAKPPEPEFIVIPPEQAEQVEPPAPLRPQPQEQPQPEPRKTESPPAQSSNS